MASVIGHSGVAHGSKCYMSPIPLLYELMLISQGAYCASKAAVISVHESLRQELVNTNNNRFSNIKAICVHPGLIETGMFTGVSHQRKWLTPALKTEEVAHAVIAAIREGQNQDIYLPLYTHAVPLLRFLPIELADWVRELCSFSPIRDALVDRSESRFAILRA
ncbi:hypothetical protein HDU85_000752 [Gaertneriomyces sp. JEL0708]|nr:hypothetical protein HDU85_000752 [Gaertneriomyces sp. JEL0708]